MKIAAKVLLILSLIFAIALIPGSICTILMFYSQTTDLLVEITGLAQLKDIMMALQWPILATIIFSCLTLIAIISVSLGKLNHSQNHKELILWGILCILSGSLVGGILLLCIKDKHLYPVAEQPKDIDSIL